MKRWMTMLLAVALTLSLAGCGTGAGQGTGNPQQGETETAAESEAEDSADFSNAQNPTATDGDTGSAAGGTNLEEGEGNHFAAEADEKDEEDNEDQGGAGGSVEGAAEEVILGDEQFDEYVPLLEGKRVALFSNHTGIVGDEVSGNFVLSEGEDASLIHFGVDADGEEITYGEHILDALLAHGVDVTAIFSPEHGFRGTEDAGATVNDSVDEKTGVPILSLYGDEDTHAPSAESMAQFDVLLVDMQDVGLRYYTYYLSMYYLMDACAAEGKEFIILDRPNPNGFYVDGPILKEGYQSNVGQLPIPIVYGMTWGELAQMINGEGWLAAGKGASDLTVIPCRNYTRQTKTSLIRNPSPNIKDMRAVYLYASTCFFENTAVSVGRGTEFPFEAYGSPYLEGVDGFDFSFTPVSMSGAAEPPFMDETCYGVDLRDIPLAEIWENQINLDYLVGAYRAVSENAPEVSFWGTPDEEGRYWIDKLTGTNEVRLQIEEGRTAEEIKAGWQEEIEAFLEQRRPYLLYEESFGGSAGIANPWSEITEEQAKEIMPNLFHAPAGASNVHWSVMQEEGSTGDSALQGPLVQLAFDLDGLHFTERACVTGDASTDISGMYYNWTISEDVSFANWGNGGLQGKAYRRVGDEETADLITWYDSETGVGYSLSTVAPDLDGFDIQAVAEASYDG